MLEINDVECYPEIQQYLLISLYDGSETRVSEKRLRDTFSEEELTKIKTGRHKLWLLAE